MTNLEMLIQIQTELQKTFIVKAEILQDNGVKTFEQLCNVSEDAANDYEQICASSNILQGYTFKLTSLLNAASSYIMNNLV